MLEIHFAVFASGKARAREVAMGTVGKSLSAQCKRSSALSTASCFLKARDLTRLSYATSTYCI